MGGGHVLVVEDDGLRVATAIDGVDAVEQAAATAPGLVVLDMSLPGLDGFGVAAALRARFGSGLPILVITADGFLHKPFDVDVRVRRVREGLAGPHTPG